MYYVSTRGSDEKISSAEAIKRGIAPDGGLYLPNEIPALTDTCLKGLLDKDYPSRAAEILSMFLSDDYTLEELKADCNAAYSQSSFPGGAAPVVKVGENLSVLELWHGPTCAFKDMALQLMPRLLSRALVKTGEKNRAFILVATSGDTGKAALEGYKDIDNIDIMVYYPRDGVSTVQKLQMATQGGKNVYVCSVEGNFDDAQNGVKAIFGSSDIAERLKKEGYILSSANSINWGRLVPQIAYYISAYCDMVVSGEIKFGEEINVTVPTGNFGNILAAYIAKNMGLPINTLVCASNKNNILTDFFETGVYDRNRSFYTTVSPSMDILISSNLERLLSMKCGTSRTAELMRQLKETGRYELDADTFKTVKYGFDGGCCDEEKTFAVIKDIFGRYGYLCDTHTAVGVSCAMDYMAKCDGKRKMLAVSTASPYKFAPAVYTAIAGKTVDELEAPELLSALTSTDIPLPIKGIKDKEIRFDPKASIKADKMADAMFAALKEIASR